MNLFDERRTKCLYLGHLHGCCKLCTFLKHLMLQKKMQQFRIPYQFWKMKQLLKKITSAVSVTGAEVAQYASKNLPGFLKKMPAYKDNLAQALEKAFLQFDETIIHEDVLKELKAMAGVESDGEAEQDDGGSNTTLISYTYPSFPHTQPSSLPHTHPSHITRFPIYAHIPRLPIHTHTQTSRFSPTHPTSLPTHTPRLPTQTPRVSP